MDNHKGKPKTNAIKIIIAVAIVALVGGIFILKRVQTQAPAAAAAQGAAASQGIATATSAQPSAASPTADQVALAAPASAGGSDLLITTPIDFAALRASGLPVIIDFGADSCVPCKEMAPVLADLNKALQGRAIIRFVDVWKYRDLANGVPVDLIPTQVFFDSKGRPFVPPDSLQLQFTLYNRNDNNEHVFTTHEGGLDKPQMLAILNAMGMK